MFALFYDACTHTLGNDYFLWGGMGGFKGARPKNMASRGRACDEHAFWRGHSKLLRLSVV